MNFRLLGGYFFKLEAFFLRLEGLTVETYLGVALNILMPSTRLWKWGVKKNFFNTKEKRVDDLKTQLRVLCKRQKKKVIAQIMYLQNTGLQDCFRLFTFHIPTALYKYPIIVCHIKL